ncbi:MAG: hypothetical protein WCI18_15560 [Pseudomonadota bacterium]
MKLAFISLILVSCGTDLKTPKGQTDHLPLNDCAPIAVPRFDGCKVAALYTENSKVDESGKTIPLSKAPLWSVWKFNEAPQALRDEWKTGDVIAEVYGYVNLGTPSDAKNVISLLERSSRFSKMLDEKGKPIFKDSYSTNKDWQKVADTVDGKVTGDIETKQLILMVPLSESLVKDARMEISYSEKAGIVSAYMYNKVAISVPLVGVIADPYGLQFKMEFYPYKNGILSYSSAVIKLKKFQDKFGNEVVGSFATSFFRWYISELTDPKFM